ncbi:MAG: hypothetical protein Q9183_006404 [Haloplaca sp. 2 TL-2023]
MRLTISPPILAIFRTRAHLPLQIKIRNTYISPQYRLSQSLESVKLLPSYSSYIMSETPDLPPKPISIHIPHSLQQYAIPLRSYLASHPQYDRLVVSAFIFAPPMPTHPHSHSPSHSPSAPSSTQQTSPTSHLLLLRRAAHDTAYPTKWEVPGGQADKADPTILHSLAREVFEETGLRLTRFLGQVGGTMEWTTEQNEGGTAAKKQCMWAKLNFHIEVQEVGKNEGGVIEEKEIEKYLANVPVEVDAEEHDAWRWVTVEELKRHEEMGKGDGDLEIVNNEQRERMLMAFGMQE